MAAPPKTAAGMALGLLLEIRRHPGGAEWQPHRDLAHGVLTDADCRRSLRKSLAGEYDLDIGEQAHRDALVIGALRVMGNMMLDKSFAQGSLKREHLVRDFAGLSALSGIVLDDVRHLLVGAPERPREPVWRPARAARQQTLAKGRRGPVQRPGWPGWHARRSG